MKTAIAAQSDSADSVIDRHFGKCPFFNIYNDETRVSEVIPNPAKGVQGCKGETIVTMLADIHVQRVIAGDFGTTVQQLLNKHHIQMILHPETNTRISEIIKLLTQR